MLLKISYSESEARLLQLRTYIFIAIKYSGNCLLARRILYDFLAIKLIANKRFPPYTGLLCGDEKSYHIHIHIQIHIHGFS